MLTDHCDDVLAILHFVEPSDEARLSRISACPYHVRVGKHQHQLSCVRWPEVGVLLMEVRHPFVGELHLSAEVWTPQIPPHVTYSVRRR